MHAMRRLRIFPFLSLLVLTLSTAPLLAQERAQERAQEDAIAIGDAAWARRAEGHQGDRALPGPVNEAIAAYERAVKEQPDRLEGTWKLLRALHYKGDFATQA